MVTANRVISSLGLLIFGGLLLLVTLAPGPFERAAKAFIVTEVRAQLEPVLESKAGRELKAAYEAWKARGEAGRSGVGADPVPAVAKKLADVLAELCHFDCADRKALESTIETGLRGTLSRLVAERDKVAALAKDKYREIVTKLRRDLIIFTAANAAIFAALLAVTFLGPRTYRALMLPAILLTISTLIAAGFYVFGQNWLFTILYDDYAGYGYLLYVALIFLFLFCVIYVRAGNFVPIPVDGGAAVAEACAAGPVASTAEAVVVGAEGIVGFFGDILSGLAPA